MKRGLLACAILLTASAPAFAHRLDEYLQGTLISIEKDRMQAELTLTPGVSVFPTLIAEIDLDGDGALSAIEQRAYATRVLGDLSLAIDQHPLTPRLLTTQFPAIADMKEGRGEIRIEFEAALPPGRANRTLTFDNRHQSRIAAYQVNSLVPSDSTIQIVAQKRNYTQSHYELEFTQPPARSASATPLAILAILMLGTLALRWRFATTSRPSPDPTRPAVCGRR